MRRSPPSPGRPGAGSGRGAGLSLRQQRAASEVREVLAMALSRGEAHPNHPLPDQPITVTEVRLSPDLRNATVLVMPLGGGAAQEQIVRELNGSIPFFRQIIARGVSLRYVPRLHFTLDTRFADDERIEALLRDPAVRRDLD